MAKIWLDVTTILGWQRPAVGIVRVEAECAKFALEQLSSDVAFCRYDPEVGYLPVTAIAVQQTVDRISHGRAAETRNDGTPTVRAPAERRLAAIVRKLVRFLPFGLESRMLQYMHTKREVAVAFINVVRELKRAWRSLSNDPRVEGRPQAVVQKRVLASPFSSDDVYVSLGLDWDQKSMSFISEQKDANGFKAIFCCYDIIPVKFPHLCVGDVASKFARYFADVAWCADEIVCISECSRRDLLELLVELGAPVPDATVFKLGSQIAIPDDTTVSEETRKVAGSRFILFVSTIERRKNHETLYRAYTRLMEQGVVDLPKLIFVGMPGWGIADFRADLQFDPRVQGMVEILSNVSDADLAWLYQNTLFTVFPSLYEGWGLAVAESLAAGKFCLASDRGSIPEVGGDLVEYLDPWDVPRWAERLKWYFDHPIALKAAEDRIRREYRPPTWEAAATTVFNRAKRLLVLGLDSQKVGLGEGTLDADGLVRVRASLLPVNSCKLS